MIEIGGGMMLESILALIKAGALLFIAFCLFKMAHIRRKAEKEQAKLWEDYIRDSEKH